jgi:hypothetical protein
MNGTKGKVAGSAEHSGNAPRDLDWVLKDGEGTVTADEYRRRLKARKEASADRD